MPGKYSRGPPVTKAQRGEPSLAAREAGTAGASCEETEGIGRSRSRTVVRARHERAGRTRVVKRTCSRDTDRHRQTDRSVINRGDN